MVNLNQRFDTAQQSIASFKEALDDFALLVKQDSYTQKEYRKNRDSLVKRFELSVDTLWKYLKFYLEARAGVVHNTPKAVFRECLKAQILNEQETAFALKMIDNRNDAVHIYRELIAEQLVEQLPLFYQLMNKLITKALPMEQV